MLKKENNLFMFATKETTQDSFFSWVINFYNTTDDELYKNFSKEFLKTILPDDLVGKINDIKSIDITRQFINIDILLTLNMKNDEQYYVIIENKTTSDLRPNQLKTILYYTRLVYCLYNEKSIFKELSINVDKEDYKDKVYAVLIKTAIRNNNSSDYQDIVNNVTSLDKDDDEYYYHKVSEDYINSLTLDKFMNKHIKLINTGDKLSKLIDVIKKYKSLDKIIENYYDSISFNLSNDSMLDTDENNIENIIKSGHLVENKTHFRINKLCFKCFSNDLTSRDLNNINSQSDNIELDRLDLKFDDGPKLIVVDTLNFKSGNNYDNTLKDNDILWYELIKETNSKNNIRYIYLFIKQIDAFRNEYYTFKGLYRFNEVIEDNGKRYNVWKKCNVSDNGRVSIKKNDIEEYINIQERLLKQK